MYGGTGYLNPSYGVVLVYVLDMDIKDFIKESLLQIVDGISETNEALKEKGAYIPTRMVVGEGVWGTLDMETNTTRHFMRVDFDLAVTVTQGDKIKAGGGLSIASLAKAGATSENCSQNEEISRIKYTIPIALPELDKDK